MIDKEYGICFWLNNQDKPNILLDTSIEEFNRLSPHGKIFDIYLYDDKYVRIVYGDYSNIILKEAIKILKDKTIFDMGEKVIDYKNRIGIIVDRFYFFKENQPMYNLLIEGKKSSKRYFSSDLSRYI